MPSSSHAFIYLIILLPLLAFPEGALAQSAALPAMPPSSGEEDVLYLRNGEVLRGRILESRDERVVRLETACRNVFVVHLDEVEEITRERIPSPRFYKQRGYVNHSGLAVLPGGGGTSLQIQMVHGYQFNPYLSAGAGLGYAMHADPVNLASVFLDVRYKVLAARLTPFVSLRGGYGFSVWADDNRSVERHSGGLMLNPALGVQFDTSGGYGWYLSMGFSSESARYEWQDWGGRTVEEEITYRRVQIGFGVSF